MAETMVLIQREMGIAMGMKVRPMAPRAFRVSVITLTPRNLTLVSV
jgi:hypothetical protein